MVDVALYEAIFAMMESMVPEFDVFGFIRERTGNIMPGITPPPSTPAPMAATYRSAPTATRSSAASCRPSAATTWPATRDWPATTGAMRAATRLYGVIDRWVASQPLEEVLAVLARAEVPASRIYSAEDMFRDPQFLAREMFLSARLPDGKPFRMPGIVPKLSATPGSADWVGPELGEHTDALLAELGYDSEGIAAPAPGRRHLNGTRSPSSVLRGQCSPSPYPARRGVIARFHEHGAIRQEPLHRRAPSA